MGSMAKQHVASAMAKQHVATAMAEQHVASAMAEQQHAMTPDVTRWRQMEALAPTLLFQHRTQPSSSLPLLDPCIRPPCPPCPPVSLPHDPPSWAWSASAAGRGGARAEGAAEIGWARRKVVMLGE